MVKKEGGRGERTPELLSLEAFFLRLFREKANRSAEFEAARKNGGGACENPMESRGEGTQGQMDSTYAGTSTIVVDGCDDYGKGQMSTEGEVSLTTDIGNFADLPRIEYSGFRSNAIELRGMFQDGVPLGPSPTSQVSSKPMNSTSHYFVEEPDSPRSSPVQNLGPPIALCNSSPIKSPRPVQVDVGLSSIFNRLLSLKRKPSFDSDYEVSVKKPHLLINTEEISNDTTFSKGIPTPHLDEGKEVPSSKSRGRGRAGNRGRSARGRRGGFSGSDSMELGLVEIPITQSADFEKVSRGTEVDMGGELFEAGVSGGVIVSTGGSKGNP
ncbi:hypothetical protein RHMOL_Rhmol07G0119500 [Rhododendron molle]|uniref:Uncharacterized protein n=1 Tax=Rhododendron molle TaxID=49168 RepID=A0ACC0N0V2_RHOML|nr:hypothetical protein RHMOL_Rhmol07G0119500 [Rhododendron molle]